MGALLVPPTQTSSRILSIRTPSSCILSSVSRHLCGIVHLYLSPCVAESVRQARALPTKKSAGVGGDTGGELPLLSFDGEGVTVVGSTSIGK